ncbi:aminoacyl-histidine dipeptidase [Chitinophaga sp. Cy-1792]|uniref:aminoacyl-histidine dipeptidase n=1 Tax=Chitinophaga sp. Cy-1792 TaxID=2608339 RepID=UPI00141E9488|nr:aminoacyl-histidine dipeptidase [Chitinophaga sp. Cy-1792]NIG57112.1 aminoacyl-histidine dipeptidase [Chitinophaga sp. Cy-1792]
MEWKDLQPQSLWSYFAQLNAIPRASKKEAAAIDFVVKFGQELGLETTRDTVGNVVIKKPATAGLENRQTVILQSHLDMVHQKNNDTDFDFDTQGINMYIDGDWVRAKGTTLGADNGIGVAAIMAILADKTLAHPALEALFTIDEETGMTGATQLDGSMLSGTIMLNLDTEEEHSFTIGCAGGRDTNTSATYQEIPAGDGFLSYLIKITGLLGGHSGMDIHKGRGNANKLMNRLLYKAQSQFDIQLVSIDGGSLRNAIPRESTAQVLVSKSEEAEFLAFISDYEATIKDEYQHIEAGLAVSITKADNPGIMMDPAYFRQLTRAIYAIPNGVYRMSPEIADLVEASTNLARVIAKNGSFTTQSLQRSSVDSTKEDVGYAVKAGFEIIGCTINQTSGYPGWKPNINSAILQVMTKLFKEQYGKEPEIGAVHAGLECGIIGAHHPGMDMISFGPTILDAHSPNERVQISAVGRFYQLLTNTLKEIPAKA